MDSGEQYRQRIKRHKRPSPLFRNCVFCFLIGGGICLFGELLRELFLFAGIPTEDAGVLSTVSLIFLSALLTGLGVYDKIARVGGAGTLVPVTGFANAVVSPAMDSESEGIILGIGSKIFSVAGPVILYGILSGALYGVVYLLILLSGGGA